MFLQNPGVRASHPSPNHESSQIKSRTKTQKTERSDHCTSGWDICSSFRLSRQSPTQSPTGRRLGFCASYEKRNTALLIRTYNKYQPYGILLFLTVTPRYRFQYRIEYINQQYRSKSIYFRYSSECCILSCLFTQEQYIVEKSRPEQISIQTNKISVFNYIMLELPKVTQLLTVLNHSSIRYVP